MPGLKKHHSDVRFSSNKVTPDELDLRLQYTVMNPTVSASWLSSGLGTGDVSVALTMTQTKMDYPRNALLTITGAAAGVGGTVNLVGTDQFGKSQTESFGFGSANGGGTIAGTKIFDTVTAGTVTIDAAGGTGVGTISLGAAIGTGSGVEAWFGLPVKVKSTSDVKRIMWNDAGTMKGVNGGTVSSTYVNTTTHAFRHNEIVAAADSINVEVLTTYNSENDVNVA